MPYRVFLPEIGLQISKAKDSRFRFRKEGLGYLFGFTPTYPGGLILFVLIRLPAFLADFFEYPVHMGNIFVGVIDEKLKLGNDAGVIFDPCTQFIPDFATVGLNGRKPLSSFFTIEETEIYPCDG